MRGDEVNLDEGGRKVGRRRRFQKPQGAGLRWVMKTWANERTKVTRRMADCNMGG